MYFRNIHLQAYGRFTDRTLPFEPDGPALYLIHGPNEAGKTTALHALADLLFGFGKSSRFDFLHDLPALAVGAEIINAKGQRLVFTRRKRNRDPLLDADGGPLAADALSPFLGAVDRVLFEGLFGLSHERLREGGEAILAGKGEVGSALFSAGAGVRDVRRVLKELKADAAQRFLPPRGRSQMLNVAKADFVAAKARRTKETLSGEQWRRLDEQRRETAQRLADLEKGLEQKKQTQARLLRIQRTKPVLARLQGLQRALDPLASYPDLAADAAEQRRELLEEIRLSERDSQQAEQEIIRLEEGLAALPVSDTLLAREGEIEALYQACGQFRKSRMDMPRRVGECQAIDAGIAVLRRDAGIGPETAVPPRKVVVRLRALIKDWDGYALRLKGSAGVAEELQLEAALCLAGLAELPEPVDPEPLSAMLREVAQQGSLTQQLAEIEREVDRLRGEIARGLANLPLWSGDGAALAQTAAPSEAQVERLESEKNGLERDLAAAGQETLRAREGLADIDGGLAALTAEGTVPTAEAVAVAREAREWGWRLIRRTFIDGSGDVAAESIRFDADYPLPRAYERSVTAADQLADARLREAERVSRFKDLNDRKKQAEARLQSALERERLATQNSAAWRERWLRLWSGCGLQPADPVEMRHWPGLRREILSHRQGLAEAVRKAGMLRERMARYHHLLGKNLALLGGGAGEATETLPARIERAQVFLERTRQALSRREHLRGQSREVEQKTAAAHERVKKVQGDIVAWRGHWGQAMADLGFFNNPSEAGVREVVSVLDTLETVRSESKNRQQLQERIDGMKADYEAFQAQVTRLTLALALPLGNQTEPVTVVEGLYARWREAKSHSQKREQWLEQRQKQRDLKARADRQRQGAMDRLELLRQAYRAETVAAMAEVEKKVAEKRHIRADQDRLQEKLTEQGDGHPLAALIAEAEAEEGDTLPGRLEVLETGLRALRADHTQMAEELGRVKADLAHLQTGSLAADAAQEAENALACVGRAAEEFVTFRLAAALLNRAVSRFQERNQDPALDRAGVLFAALTLGAYTGLETEYDDKDRTFLLAVRAGGARVRVEALSDGTRDQLFLAIRLALVEMHLRHNEPMPLVVDDILVHFDNQRAGAALKVLAALSQKTQVLFFTHHAHLLEVARREVGDGVAVVRLEL